MKRVVSYGEMQNNKSMLLAYFLVSYIPNLLSGKLVSVDAASTTVRSRAEYGHFTSSISGTTVSEAGV